MDIIEEKLQLFIGMSGPLLFYFLPNKIINKVRKNMLTFVQHCIIFNLPRQYFAMTHVVRLVKCLSNSCLLFPGVPLSFWPSFFPAASLFLLSLFYCMLRLLSCCPPPPISCFCPFPAIPLSCCHLFPAYPLFLLSPFPAVPLFLLPLFPFGYLFFLLPPFSCCPSFTACCASFPAAPFSWFSPFPAGPLFCCPLFLLSPLPAVPSSCCPLFLLSPLPAVPSSCYPLPAIPSSCLSAFPAAHLFLTCHIY